MIIAISKSIFAVVAAAAAVVVGGVDADVVGVVYFKSLLRTKE